jgi:DNA-binding transcriptional ArsR family regulator
METGINHDTIFGEEAGINESWMIFRAIDHTLRSQMIRLIHENGEMTVTEIYLKLHLEQSLASQHLAVLRKTGFVYTKRTGKHIYYSVNYDHLDKVQSLARKLLA